MQKYLVAALIAISSISVVASEIKAYNAESVAVSIATSHCPTELADLSNDGLVESASVQSIEGEDIYTLNFAAGGYAPTFQTYPAGTLTITKALSADIAHEYSCLVTR